MDPRKPPADAAHFIKLLATTLLENIQNSIFLYTSNSYRCFYLIHVIWNSEVFYAAREFDIKQRLWTQAGYSCGTICVWPFPACDVVFYLIS